MNLSSPAFKNNGDIPDLYTCDGEEVSPPLEVRDLPPDTQTLVLIMEDPDAAIGTFDHWIIFNISPQSTDILEAQEPIGTPGKNSSGELGYIGPCPPKGVHHYVFTVYALDNALDLPQGASKKEVLNAMNKHIIDKAKLVGLYGKRK